MDQQQENVVSEDEVVPSVLENLETTEKLVKQSDVDKAVKHAKYVAYEQGRKEAFMQLPSPSPENNSSVETTKNNSAPSHLSGLQGMTPDEVKKMISEHEQQQAQQYHAHQIANEFLAKLEAGKDKYPDFDKTIESLELSTIPQVVQLANTVDNTSDVMYELGKNPHKVANLLSLSQLGNGRLAILEMKKLSDSIRKNQEAMQQPIPPEPLSQLKPSRVGTDNGVPSIRDLRKQPYLRV
jgi:hypothetical protein